MLNRKQNTKCNRAEIKSLNNTKFGKESQRLLLVSPSAALYCIHLCIFLCVKKNWAMKNAIPMYSLLNDIDSVFYFSGTTLVNT